MGQTIYERLVAGHVAVERLARDLALLCSVPNAPDPAILADARWVFSRAILEHVAFKDKYVYINLEASPDPQVRDLIMRLRGEQVGLHESFRSHMVKWSGEAVAADWRGFRRDMAYMHDIFHARLRLEVRELHPAVARAGDDAAMPGQPAKRNWARDAWVIRDAVHGG